MIYAGTCKGCGTLVTIEVDYIPLTKITKEGLLCSMCGGADIKPKKTKSPKLEHCTTDDTVLVRSAE